MVLANERIKFHISPEEMQHLKLNYCLHSSDTDGLDVDEMVAFAASLDDYHELEPGDIIWAKVTGMCDFMCWILLLCTCRLTCFFMCGLYVCEKYE